MVEALAGILAAQDQRRYDASLLASAAHHPAAIVRQQAALAMGRIRDLDATPVLLELLADPDTLVQQDAAFGLGLLADTAVLGALRDIVIAVPPRSQTGMHAEIVTAIAKMGGAAIFAEILERWQTQVESGDPPLTVRRALAESWRLGAVAPVQLLVPFGTSASADARRGAIYSLSRLRAPLAAAVLVTATADRDPFLREVAVRALTAAYADSAGMDRTGLANRVRRLVDDSAPGVRINALRALATFGDPALAAAAVDRVSDSDPNVRVQALAALGDLGGADAAAVLAPQVDRGLFAARRQALLSLARRDRALAIRKAAAWITDDDWLLRANGADALGIVAGDTALAWLEELTEDGDARVVAHGFSALAQAAPRRAGAIATRLLGTADPVVAAAAADYYRDHPIEAEVAPLLDALARAQAHPIPQARVAIVRALGAVAGLGAVERTAVEDAVLRRFPSSDDYLTRRAADTHLPGVARRWGAAFPLASGRAIGDYRDLARRYLVPPRARRSPGLVIETDRGRIGITLFGDAAPITVHTILELADRRYFDGSAWHRVVPNFVIQDGDPRGDGWGGPGLVLRDEINRHAYETGTVGIALDGPDTGGSQFFITLSPQPHLDGTYTVIGRVDTGMAIVERTTQGDRIRSVRRR